MAKKAPPAQVSRVLAGIRKEAARQGLTAYALSQRTGLAINTCSASSTGASRPPSPPWNPSPPLSASWSTSTRPSPEWGPVELVVLIESMRGS